MEGRLVWSLVLLAACGAEIADVSGDGGTRTDGSNMSNSDGGTDGSSMLGPWGTPMRVSGADTTADEDDVALSATLLELYFKRNDANGDANLYVLTRQSVTSPWSAPMAVTALNTTPTDEESPRFADNDLTLYFGRGGDIYKATRTAVGMPWGNVQPVAALNTTAYEKWGVVCANGYAMVSRAVTNQGQEIFDGTITGGTNNAVAVLNSVSQEQGMFLSADCLRVYYQSNRDNNQFNIYTSSRTSTSSAWSTPTAMTDFNTATSSEEDPWLSADQRTFAFCSDSAGSKDLYIATR